MQHVRGSEYVTWQKSCETLAEPCIGPNTEDSDGQEEIPDRVCVHAIASNTTSDPWIATRSKPANTDLIDDNQ
jgi:hypothetical protein